MKSNHPRADSEQIQGVLDTITFRNEENGFTVARLKEGGAHGKIHAVVGYLSGVPAGSTLALSGSWGHDARYGRQFMISAYELLKPNTLSGIEHYLGSGLIKGIGPKFAARIVMHFGMGAMDILENEPERLSEVNGLGRKRIELIKKAWKEQRDIHKIMVFLQGYGISPAYAVKIFKAYGADSRRIIENNPYRVAEDIQGIGFKTADRIAQATGIPARDPRRARAGLLFVLKEAANDGHCFLHIGELLTRGHELLELTPEMVEAQLPGLIKDEKAVLDDDRVYLAPFYFAEKGAAASLSAIRRTPAAIAGVNDRAVDEAARSMGLSFTGEQKKAVTAALTHKITVLTGGPGTGKSTILKALVLVLEAAGRSFKLAAPTGRAAKRLSEATGREATTIHRLLEFDPSSLGFKRNRRNPLSTDYLIIDEASMMDIILANSTFKAIPIASSLLLAGDADQLPSVGPGNVFKDIIGSGTIPVIRLSRIFRQAPGSLISINAALINQGKALELLPDYTGDKDFYFINRERPEEIEEEILSLCGGRLKQKFGFNPLHDIQVLSPMRKGIIGTENLNLRLREILNPHARAIGKGCGPFREGDKVMQIRNNYEKAVFNGDIGFVVDQDFENNILKIVFDGRPISYELSTLNELELAYAVTIHKSQGSELPCVILPLHTSHYPLLQRNLLYTGITRGKRLVIIVGSKKALGLAIRNNKVVERNTGLKESLHPR